MLLLRFIYLFLFYLIIIAGLTKKTMKKIMTNYLLGSLAIVAILFSTSCGDGDGDSIPAPTASFTSTVDGKTITLTNTSTDGATYAWDFGDGGTSTDESPSHTYDANGSYVVKLTVTNETGSDDSQAVVEIVNISIDGDFSDWADVPAITSAIADGETLKLFKVENLGNNKLFIYIEGTSDLTPLMQIMLDLDNNNTTGAFIDWIYFEAGEDVLIEGALPFSTETDAQYGSVYPCSPCDGSSPGNWNWGADPVLDNIADFCEASELKTVTGGLAFELAIDLTALGTTVGAEGIRIGVLDISLETWGPVSAIPARYNENTNATGTLHSYTFN
ncbi:MAG: PKD repeat protein [Cyclobacteriaceae bacterium]